MKAHEFLTQAEKHMAARAETYDTPEGERAMAKTIAAFNALAGADLTVAEGYLFMVLLKSIRLTQRATYHADSAEDLVAYAALVGEAKSQQSA